MFRGTNPKFKFTLPFPVKELSSGFVTFSQYQEIIAEKEISKCTCENNEIICELSQDETLKFDSLYPAEIENRS